MSTRPAVQFVGRPVIEALTPREVREQNGGGAQLYVLREPFACVSEQFGTIIIPAGFMSDFASIPRAALWYLDDDSPEILFGSLVHDYLYSLKGALPERSVTRQQADDLLRDSMLSCGASRLQAAVVCTAVRTFGKSYWNSP